MSSPVPPPTGGAILLPKKVGYKSPPEYSRWTKGQSGNPRGRPKGSGNFLTDLSAELGETLSITEGGRQKWITKRRGLIKSLLASALSKQRGRQFPSWLIAKCAPRMPRFDLL